MAVRACQKNAGTLRPTDWPQRRLVRMPSLGGLYEAIERDGVHVAVVNALSGVEMPRLDLSSIDHECAELVAKINDAGARIFIFDTRNETRVPCFMGLIVDTERLGLWRGYGAHSDNHIALTRAICETAQTRAILMAGARDDILWQRHQTLMRDSGAAELGRTSRQPKAQRGLQRLSEFGGVCVRAHGGS